MSILIGKYEFDGPYKSVADLEDRQGLYVVLHQDGDNYELMHVSHADNIRERIEYSQSGFNPTSGRVLLAACYTPQCGLRERRAMVEDILLEFNDRVASKS